MGNHFSQTSFGLGNHFLQTSFGTVTSFHRHILDLGNHFSQTTITRNFDKKLKLRHKSDSVGPKNTFLGSFDPFSIIYVKMV